MNSLLKRGCNTGLQGLVCGLLFTATPAFAQEPACAAVPESGRSCVDVIVVDPATGGQGRTGVSAFASDNEPGNDSGPGNHVVRTLDLLIYELRYRVLHQPSTGTRIRVTLPAGMRFAESPNSALGGAPIPSYCQSGSAISGQTLSCELGTVADGTTRSVVVLARPEFTVSDGTVLRAEAEISASNQQTTGAVLRTGYQDPVTEQTVSCTETRNGSVVTLNPCGDIVSARARFDLEFSGYSSTNLLDRGARGPQINRPALSTTVTTVVGGPAGRRGYTLAYPVAIALPGDGVGGAPLTSVAPFALTQRLSNSDGLSGFGELVGCGVNGNNTPVPNGTLMPAGWAVGTQTPTDLRAVFHPFGSIGLGGSTAENAAFDSGAISCTQSVAGGDITLNINPAAQTFDPPSFPTRQVDAQIVPRRYVLVAMVIVFYPAEPVLTPPQGGTGDGSVTIRHNIGVLNAGNLRALNLGGADEPDGPAINDGFAGVQTYDDDNNNFSIATLDAGFGRYQKTWRNPRLDTFYVGFPYCLKDSGDPTCRHGHVFPGSNIQSEFFYSNGEFTAYSNARFCDEWDPARTRLRLPFDPLAQAAEMPPNGALFLDLDGSNASSAVLNSAGFTVEVSTDAGSVPNIDWFSTEPARTDSRSQVSAPECASGNWVAATLPPTLVQGRQRIQLPASLESPQGSGQYPTIRRVRIRAQTLPPFITLALRGSYEVLASTPGTRLPNRTSFAFDNSTTWTYAENDHAIVRSADTSISMFIDRNLTTGQLGPLTSIGFGEAFRTVISTRFSSGEVNPPPSAQPLVVRAYLPLTLDAVPGSAVPALHVPPYAGTNPETLQPATVLEWHFTGLRPGSAVPNVQYDAQLNFTAANNSAIHTSATVEHPLDPSPLFEVPIFASAEDRLAIQDLTASVTVGLLVSKTTSTPFVERNSSLAWDLRYANTSGSPFAAIRIIDVLPYNGDSVNTLNAFSGSFAGGTLSPTLPGEYTLYTTSSPVGSINRNPNCVSNGGSIADGAGACPASGASWIPSPSGAVPAGSTAVRIDDGNGLAASSAQTIRLQLDASGNSAGDDYENSFAAVALGESLVLASAKSQVRIPAGELFGQVYADLDNSTSPTSNDVGIGNVLLTLTGADNAGNKLEIQTRSVDSFFATSVSNDVRINGGSAQTITCTPDQRLRRGEYLFCRLPSAGPAGYTLRETQPPDYLDRNETLGALASGASPGLLGNDVFTAIAVRNNLSTGANERGTAYAFGEFPQFAIVSGRVYREASTPANTNDDDDEEDPGLVTSLRLQCAPAYTGPAVQSSGSDGRYMYAQVPVGARCTITETQPAGYSNAYNTRGPGGVTDTGSAGTGDSSITLDVPAAGSSGNNFAEMQAADTVSAISCTPARPRPGEAVSCAITCTNLGPSAATYMTCNALDLETLPNAQQIGCLSTPSVAAGGLRYCTLNFTMPASGYVVVNAGSGAQNDINGGPDPRAGNNPSRATLGVVAIPLPLSSQSSLWLLGLLSLLALIQLRRPR